MLAFINGIENIVHVVETVSFRIVLEQTILIELTLDALLVCLVVQVGLGRLERVQTLANR